MNTVRRAEVADTPALVRMGCRFIAESSYRGEVVPNPQHQAQLVAHLLEHGAVFTGEVGPGQDPVGFIAFALLPAVLSGEPTACEIAWWVEPEWRRGHRFGAELLRRAEQWAEDAGAHAIQMVQPVGNEEIGRVYARRGYRPLETVWHRRLAR